MSEQNKDDLIDAQRQVIGILFEVIKRLQANNNLDLEYFQIIGSKKTIQDQSRLTKIMAERQNNAKIVSRLLKQLEI